MSGLSPALELTCELISRESVTPDDAGCQQLIADRLKGAGFHAEQIDFNDVRNLWATHGEGSPVLVFLGHTDVVPTGPVEQWTSPPFRPSFRDDRLYGRGAADMKASVAAFVVALERFVAAHPAHEGTVALLLTSDEEGESIDGVKKVVPVLTERGLNIDYCVVGEPSSLEQFGDNLRIGRRGSVNLEVTVHGVQGHSAYPEKADNPIHRAAPALAELAAREWDQGTEHFPPTTLQITNCNAGTGAYNVIPGRLIFRCNFRHTPQFTADDLEQEVRSTLERHQLRVEIKRLDPSLPFLTSGGPLVDAMTSACRQVLGITPVADTCGGTSDGRFIAPTGAAVVEFGPINESIHKIDEWVAVDAVDKLVDIYQNVAESLLT